MLDKQVFISYAGRDSFEASLLKYAFETLLHESNIVAWIFQHDQNKSEREVAQSLKRQVQNSVATIFLVSPYTLERGASQWMELAYADAFDVPTFVLLHRLQYSDLQSPESGSPPLLLSGQCNPASDWRAIVQQVGDLVTEGNQNDQ